MASRPCFPTYEKQRPSTGSSPCWAVICECGWYHQAYSLDCTSRRWWDHVTVGAYPTTPMRTTSQVYVNKLTQEPLLVTSVLNG